MDWITPFDWDLPDRKIAGVRTEAEYLDKLTSLVRDKTPDDGMILSWGYHHYYHGHISRKVRREYFAVVSVIIIASFKSLSVSQEFL